MIYQDNIIILEVPNNYYQIITRKNIKYNLNLRLKKCHILKIIYLRIIKYYEVLTK